MDEITDDMVERTAMKLSELYDSCGWNGLLPSLREDRRTDARIILDAALNGGGQ